MDSLVGGDKGLMATVTISKDEYEKLLKGAGKLRCLEAAGVDNWEGYGYAMEMLGEYEEE